MAWSKNDDPHEQEGKGVVNQHQQHVQAHCCLRPPGRSSCCRPPSLWRPPPPPPPPPPPTRRRSFPLSHSPTSMESLTTTPRLTSRRLRLRMLRARLLDLSPSLSLTAGSRPPPILLITTMGLLLRSPTREPLSTPQSPRKATDTLPPSTRLPLSMPLPLPTSLLLNLF